MEDINFASIWAPRLRFERNGKNGIDVDFFDETNGKHLAGRHLTDKDVKDLVEFLAPTTTIRPDVRVNDIINGFPEPERVHAWARNLRVTDLDYPLAPETGKGVRAVDATGTAYAFRYDEFEIVERAEVPATTERVSIELREDLRVGDVIVENDMAKMGPVVDRQVPAKPAEPEFGHGTAYVFGGTLLMDGSEQKRYRGFRSAGGNFYYLSDAGHQRTASESQHEGFRLED